MGCDGCELWNEKKNIKKCYAGTLTERYAGLKGWPEAFTKPKVFPERLRELLRWADLTGTERPTKPWLNGYPRLVFLDDMGDTFTESLPLEWFDPFLQPLASCPHIIQLLTKRPKRMAQYFKTRPVPRNFWLMTTVTNAKTLRRAHQLAEIAGAAVYGLSVEPMWGRVDLRPLFRDMPRPWWVIAGGESGGADPVPCHPQWARHLRDECAEYGVPFFWKQWGVWLPADQTPEDDPRRKAATRVYQDYVGGVFPLDEAPDSSYLQLKLTKKAAGRLLDGMEHNGMPELKGVLCRN